MPGRSVACKVQRTRKQLGKSMASDFQVRYGLLVNAVLQFRRFQLFDLKRLRLSIGRAHPDEDADFGFPAVPGSVGGRC